VLGSEEGRYEVPKFQNVKHVVLTKNVKRASDEPKIKFTVKDSESELVIKKPRSAFALEAKTDLNDEIDQKV
jgi:hypothetical protein